GRCLEKEPVRRFQSAQELAEQLALLRAQVSLPTDVEVRPRGRRGRRWMVGVTALGLLAGVGVLSILKQDAGSGPGASGGRGETPSIAVLPFVNLSSDKEQEYFSDGITEELTDALARLKNLKVAGRTSAFHFKGKNEDLHTIGKALGVANILEGSVRKQG